MADQNLLDKDPLQGILPENADIYAVSAGQDKRLKPWQLPFTAGNLEWRSIGDLPNVAFSETDEVQPLFDALNARPLTQIPHNSNFYFSTVNIVATSSNTATADKRFYVLRNKITNGADANGVYFGQGSGITLSAANMKILRFEQQTISLVNGEVTNTAVNDLGVINTTPIEDAINAAGPFTPVNEFVLFEANDGTSTNYYIYTGAEDQIGTGAAQVTANDIRMIDPANSDAPTTSIDKVVKVFGENGDAKFGADLLLQDSDTVTFTKDPTTGYLKANATVTVNGSVDGNAQYINRGNATEDVAPTSGEIGDPQDGDTAIVNLTSGKAEYWNYTTAWNKAYTIDYNGTKPVTSYASQSALLAEQSNHKEGYVYYDGTNEYVYNGTPTGSISDYRLRTSESVATIKTQYYVEDFGAKFDTKHFLESISTSSGSAVVNVTGASFVSDDVDKVFVIKDAGVSGGDLVSTIISVQSSTQVTLSNNASVSLTDVDGCYGTDDTSAIQSAIDFCNAEENENLPILLPSRTAIINGDFQTNVNSVNFNSQLYIPVRDSRDPQRRTIALKGTTIPSGIRTAGIGVQVEPITGTILLSTRFGVINGGIEPSVICGRDPFSPNNFTFTYNTPELENISIQSITDSNNAMRIGGVNFFECGAAFVKNITCYPYRGNLILSGRPPFSISGIQMCQTNNEHFSIIENCTVGGYENGVVFGEHTNTMGVVNAISCYNGHVFTVNSQIAVAKLKSYWCANDIFINSTSPVHFKALIDTETSATGKWYDNLALISDPNNVGLGVVEYSIVEESFGVNYGKFKKDGAAFVKCIPIALNRWNGLVIENYDLNFLDGYRESSLGSPNPVTLNILQYSAGHYDVGVPYKFRQGGAGQVSVVPSPGVSMVFRNNVKTLTQGDWVELTMIRPDEWVARGDIEFNNSPQGSSTSVWSLRQVNSSAESVLVIQRNDGAVATVKFNPITGYCDMDSEIVSSNSGLADGTPVSTFVNGGDARIKSIKDQYNFTDSDYTFSRSLFSEMPYFAKAGVQSVKNGNPAIEFDGGQYLSLPAPIQALGNVGPFSIFSKVAAKTIDHIGTVLGTSSTVDDRLVTFRDSRNVSGRNVLISTSTQDYFSNLNTPNQTTDYVQSTVISDGTNVSSWSDGIAGDAVVVPQGVYINDTLLLGIQQNSALPLTGYLSELRIYQSDETANRTTIESEIS